MTMTLSEAKEYDRWWTQNSYKYKDGIPPRVLQAREVLAKVPPSSPVKQGLKVPKIKGKRLSLDD